MKATVASSQTMAMVTLPKIEAMAKPKMMATDSPRMMATVSPRMMAMVSLRTMAMVSLRMMDMVKPRTMATESPRTMATVNLRTLAGVKIWMEAMESPKTTMASEKPKIAATDSLKATASIELQTTLIKPKLSLRMMATVSLRTIATAKSMKAIFNQLKIVDLNLSEIICAVKNSREHIKLLRTAEHKETLVVARWMDTSALMKL